MFLLCCDVYCSSFCLEGITAVCLSGEKGRGVRKEGCGEKGRMKETLAVTLAGEAPKSVAAWATRVSNVLFHFGFLIVNWEKKEKRIKMSKVHFFEEE